MRIRSLSAFILSTGALWAGASQSFAQPQAGYEAVPWGQTDASIAVGGCVEPGGTPAPIVQQYGPSRVYAGPLGLDVVQGVDGSLVAYVAESQIPLSELIGTRLVLGWASATAPATLSWSPARSAFVGTLPDGAWLGAVPTVAQLVPREQPRYLPSYPSYTPSYYPTAPPPFVVRAVPAPRRPIFVTRFPRRAPPPPVVRAFPSRPFFVGDRSGRGGWQDDRGHRGDVDRDRGRDRDGRSERGRDRGDRGDHGRDRGDRGGFSGSREQHGRDHGGRQ